ncbi:MAG: MarR family winged helix-turn-helix transcriptional regulator [Trinickia sp.]|jgi:DNA-binding MarR family transcriptional regulator|uniref:MarR family winged helix-turn-helix transcriptional regulator n=1 Tax=Trinickia sp. TaxID=2571163 RepID=UPI003F7FA6A6
MEDYVAIVQQFGRAYRAFLSAFEARVGHAMPRWRILRTLTEDSGEWSQKRLVERLRIDPGALTRQLKSLEALGWIERSIDARDNRITNVRLTQEGRHVVDASLPQRNLFLRETMGALPDEALHALSDALAKLETRIGDVADSPLSIDMVEGPDAAAEGDALERLTHTR